ncbi:MAG: peroxidase, partial [Pacificimonas sp.]
MADHEHHGMKRLDGMAKYCRQGVGRDGEQRDDRFGRMFPKLDPAFLPKSTLETIGRAGGPMDEKDENARTATVPVGLIFFGQFVDHDVTLDASTSFDSVIDDPGEVPNVRTPTLDLDCIYGLGPEAQPYLYNADPPQADGTPAPFNGVKLLVGADNAAQGALKDYDVLRAPNNRAIIGDPRNDENRIISQIQLAIIRFHNHVADTLYKESKAD